jgi:hypothetical protein
VWPPIAMLGGVSAPPFPILSLTTKCGVEGGGCVCVRWAACVLVLELGFDELWVEEPDAAAVEELADAAVEELADDVVAAVVTLDPAPADERVLEDVLWVVEWLPDPHAATSSAVTSAAAARLTIA